MMYFFHSWMLAVWQNNAACCRCQKDIFLSQQHGNDCRSLRRGKEEGWGHRVLTSLSFHRPGMQKDSRRSLPHRSKMRNSTDDKQAGGKRPVLSKQHVYWIQTRHSRKETRAHDTESVQDQVTKRLLTNLLVSHRSPQVSVFIWQKQNAQCPQLVQESGLSQ